MIKQLVECDGCGARTAPSAGILHIPPGWLMFGLEPLGGELRQAALCPPCRESPEAMSRAVTEILAA
jgi:hypothetical protein